MLVVIVQPDRDILDFIELLSMRPVRSLDMALKICRRKRQLQMLHDPVHGSRNSGSRPSSNFGCRLSALGFQPNLLKSFSKDKESTNEGGEHENKKNHVHNDLVIGLGPFHPLPNSGAPHHRYDVCLRPEHDLLADGQGIPVGKT
jgi:hypothetical protein